MLVLFRGIHEGMFSQVVESLLLISSFVMMISLSISGVFFQPLALSFHFK
jgi:hypothetical protein